MISSDESRTGTAATCRCDARIGMQKIMYQFIEEPHLLCADKKEILLAQIIACQKLLKYAETEYDRELVTKEISDIQLALDLLQ